MIGQYLNQSNSVQTDILLIGRHKTNAEPIISLGNDVMSIFNQQKGLSASIGYWSKLEPIKNLRSQHGGVHDQFSHLQTYH